MSCSVDGPLSSAWSNTLRRFDYDTGLSLPLPEQFITLIDLRPPPKVADAFMPSYGLPRFASEAIYLPTPTDSEHCELAVLQGFEERVDLQCCRVFEKSGCR